ncbi:Crp/Fnr family transcriptional regulator [Streptomyces armeniacus]|uniref:Crp/Fnr family transcriptional regulator n=1 Tax=Streptomyces armeniacus TaxID=83291 RepID=A0A345XVT4_9ACTN|nr:Crp/Fnr family transcriptional regulator [Streptomyces armeniacus]AXK35750.1 Crp/Fnr family transcriptional regulator [Streptomyces armeniacus]
MNFRSQVSAQVWQDLIDRGRRRTYPSKSVLLAQGESPDCVIALVDGLVKVVQSNERGDELTLMLRGPGEVLGEMGVLLGRSRSATVTAALRCAGVVLPAHAFRGYVERHRLETTVYQLTVERLNSHERLQADLAHLPPAGRMARVVSHLADEVGTQQEPTGLLVELGMPRAELATMAGMRRSSALAALGQLQSAGILTLGRRRLTVNDVACLKEVAKGHELPGGMGRKDGTPAV